MLFHVDFCFLEHVSIDHIGHTGAFKKCARYTVFTNNLGFELLYNEIGWHGQEYVTK